ncbi:bifunctional 3-(3-hydroxy-phenyl)propionate/3-hydroxycinnamic acid hydroxylase [Flexivirga oryzae]|nr:bifunctional 3-(3-hydroxy-phenyl)propionate/3-hydroxycinnamic acid hydroxylase [Flexivirga oryzae]
MDVYDVAIVGYGPVGQSLAIMLGQAGWRTVVLEKQSEIYPLPRACHLDHEAMRIFQNMGIAEQVSEVIVPARDYQLLRGDLSVLASLPRIWETPSGWEPSYHFYQPDVEGILDRTALSTTGVELRRGVAVTDVRDQVDGVELDATSADGTREVVCARYVIGADGANSVVRRAAGIAQQDLGFEATWVVTDLLLNEGEEPLGVPDTGQVCDPAQPTHMAWLGGRHYRWEFMLVDDVAPETAQRPDNVWAKLARWVTPDTAELVRSTAYTFRSVVAETLNKGHVLLAGDSGHLMPPFMGQGMVSGLRDVATLSWLLDRVLRGESPTELLGAYTASRSAHVIAYIEQSVDVGRIICETDPVLAQAKAVQLENDGEAPPFQPPVTALLRPGQDDAGRLSIQPRLADGRLLDDVVTGLRLLIADRDALAGLPEPTAGLLRSARVTTVIVHGPGGTTSLDSDVVEVAEPDRRFGSWLAAAGCLAALVRPDGYLYGVAVDSHDLVTLVETLATDLGVVAPAQVVAPA